MFSWDITIHGVNVYGISISLLVCVLSWFRKSIVFLQGVVLCVMRGFFSIWLLYLAILTIPQQPHPTNLLNISTKYIIELWVVPVNNDCIYCQSYMAY